MNDEREPSDAERMFQRAGKLALGLADTGLGHAEAMLYRLSPEGRAQARRARERRARRRNRILGQLVFALLLGMSLLFLVAMAGLPPALGLALLTATLAASVALILRREGRAANPDALPAADLPLLPAQAGAWLATQRKALPAPALRFADALGSRLDDLAPQLARLPPETPAAAAVRKLVAVELPALVEGWRAVPPSLRREPGPTGRTPDAQLADGLKLIDAEVARMTEQLARGAVDEVTTQGRYLQLKYGEGDLSA